MSLMMSVEFVGASATEVERLALQARDRFGFDVTYRPRQPAIQLNGAHDALTDEADWNAPYWAMDPSSVRKIEAEVRTLHSLSKRDILVRAIWAGDEVREQVSATIDDMIAVLREGRLGTHTEYRVEKHSNAEPQSK